MENSDNIKLFMEQEQMIGTMLRYPPFATNPELYFAAIETASGGELPKDKSLDEVVEWQLQKLTDAMQKYAQEFEEASLWMARYPFDSGEAVEMAMSMDGKSDDDISIHLATRG
jgi:hypothetical protein